MSTQSTMRGFKIFGFGLLLFIITMVLFFVMAIISGQEEPIYLWWVGVVMGVIMAACSLRFSRLMKPATTKQALTYGIIWAIMVALILFITGLPNNTIGIIFGHLSIYLVFIGIAVGPVFLKQKPTALKTNMPQ